MVLDFFTLHNVSKVFPGCGMCQGFILFKADYVPLCESFLVYLFGDRYLGYFFFLVLCIVLLGTLKYLSWLPFSQ